MKPSRGRLKGRSRGRAMFPGLSFRPGQSGGLPFMGRRRFAVGAFGRFQPPKIYGRLGPLEVRLARKKSEIRRASDHNRAMATIPVAGDLARKLFAIEAIEGIGPEELLGPAIRPFVEKRYRLAIRRAADRLLAMQP